MIHEIIVIVCLSIFIDYLFGEPPLRIHPVVWIGKIINFSAKSIKKISMKEKKKNEKIFGSILALGVTLIIWISTYVITIQLQYFLGTLGFIISSSIILKTTFSIKSMDKHINEILTEIEAKNIEKARISLSKIVSRDTQILSEQKILSACIECVAESFMDGVLSPLFYYGILNIPGAMMFRTVNTLDSMIGYKDDYHKNLGWMSAKMDTWMNAIPSRLTTIFLIIASFLCKQDWRNSIAIYKRDRKNTESFNAGIPMSIMAGALNIQLEKINHYKLGDLKEIITIDKCRTSLKITKIATIIFVISFLFPVIVIIDYIGWWSLLFGY